MALWNMIPTAVSTVYGLFNQPKESDFMPKKQISALQNMITERQNMAEGKNLAHAMSRPAIRQSAINREKSKRGLAEQVARGSISEGDAIQAGIEGDVQRDRALTDVQDRAMAQQIQQNQEGQRAIDKARTEIAGLKDQARQQFSQAKRDWWGGLAQNVSQAGLQLGELAKSGGIEAEMKTFLGGKSIPEYLESGGSVDALKIKLMMMSLGE